MNYQSYEDYMKSVLGYSPYVETESTYPEREDYYDNPNVQPSQDLTPFYPEIYKITYPMVCKICNTNSNRELTKELLEQMIDEIYINVEPEDNTTQIRQLPPLKNGDVRNPNAKEEQVVKETRQTNFLLRDLIRILILREWGRPSRPPFPRPPMGPGMPQPPRPGNGRPPINPPPRPRYY